MLEDHQLYYVFSLWKQNPVPLKLVRERSCFLKNTVTSYNIIKKYKCPNQASPRVT